MMKHISNRYGFNVMTSQEKELEFNQIDTIYINEDNIYSTYDTIKNIEFEPKKKEKIDKQTKF